MQQFLLWVDNIQDTLIAASHCIATLARISHFSSMTTDFRLPVKPYKFVHSSWFCSSLIQVVNNGCVVYNCYEQVSVVVKLLQRDADFLIERQIVGKSGFFTFEDNQKLEQIKQNIMKCQSFAKQASRKIENYIPLIKEVADAIATSDSGGKVKYMDKENAKWVDLEHFCDAFLSEKWKLHGDKLAIYSSAICDAAVKVHLASALYLQIASVYSDLCLLALDMKTITDEELQEALMRIQEIVVECKVQAEKEEKKY